MKNKGTSNAILGSGAFGSAIGSVLEESSTPTFIYGPSHELEKLDHLSLEKKIWNFDGPPHLNKGTQWIILAVPTKALRFVCELLRDSPQPEQGYVIVSKGIEQNTWKLPYEVFQEVLGEIPFLILGGPNFAKELKEKSPGGTTLASSPKTLAETFQKTLNETFLKTQVSQDLIGVSLSGVFKNVIALASGASDALGLGHNARASLITLGVQDYAALNQALGGQVHSFFQFSGIGDLVLTAVGDLSRNRSFGRLMIEQPEKKDEYVKNHTCEGFLALEGLYQISLLYDIPTVFLKNLKLALDGEKSFEEALKKILQSIH